VRLPRFACNDRGQARKDRIGRAQNNRELSLRGALATKQSRRRGASMRLPRFARNDRGQARNDR